MCLRTVLSRSETQNNENKQTSKNKKQKQTNTNQMKQTATPIWDKDRRLKCYKMIIYGLQPLSFILFSDEGEAIDFHGR